MRKKEDRKSYDRIYGFLKEIGVTLIALVVTIVVLLILAGIRINAVLGNNGVIKQAKNAASLSKESDVKGEISRIVVGYHLTDGYESLEDYLKTKVEEGKIDGVTNNGDGTLTVKKDGYSVTVDDSKQPSNDTATDKGTLVINTKIAKFAQNTVSAQLSFSVKAELNGKNVYNNIVNVAHSKNAGEKAMVIKDIPVGANVTINAIYNTLSYKLTSSETATVKLENNTKTVNFEYTYDYKNISGSSATTAVVYNGSSLSQK